MKWNLGMADNKAVVENTSEEVVLLCFQQILPISFGNTESEL
jgi:hypothetical protein